MKKPLHIIFLSSFALTLTFCKTTKKQESTMEKSNKETVAVSENSARNPVIGVAPSDVVKADRESIKETLTSVRLTDIANKRWEGTTSEELTEGKNIYAGKCIKCHINYPIEEFSEKKWIHEIDDMSPKAKLTAEEKLKLTKYILSYREMKDVSTGN